MPIQVKLLLPDNLQSTYLRADFVNRGEVYSIKRSSVQPSLDTNRHALTFGFELIDTETRLPVDLNRVVSLRLSNDKEFDPNSTIELTDWPSGGGFDSSLDYVIDLDPDYFFGGNDVEITPRPTPGSGSGLFIVNNWPLSSNGGLTSVYMQAVVESTGLSEGTYPEGYGLFDQIFWQGELPSIPGDPIIESLTPGWTGSKTLVRFRSSEEPSTGLYSSGISRYLGQIVEVRKVSGNYDFFSSRGTTTSGNFRTLAPGVSAKPTTLTITGYNTNFAATTFGSNAGRVLGSNLDLDTTVHATLGRGAMFYVNQTQSFDPTAPDFFVQARVGISLDSPANTTTRYTTKIVKTSLASSPGSSQEIVLRLTIPPIGAPSARVVTNTNGVESVAYSEITLPPESAPVLINGGVIEIYAQATTSGYYLLDAYFTPDDHSMSYLLASTAVPSYTGALTAAIGASIQDGDGTVRCDEIAMGGCRLIQSADIGDAQFDDLSNAFLPSLNISTDSGEWAAALEDYWIRYSEGTSIQPLAISDALSFPYNEAGAQEVQTVYPTLSERINLSWSMEHSVGEFYVCISPTPTSEASPSLLRPMGMRCRPEYNLTSEPMNAPTIMVGFSAKNKNIFISQRLQDGSLRTNNWRLYDTIANGVANYSLTLDADHSNNFSDGASVVLKRNADVIGVVKTELRLPSADEGIGFFVSMGTYGDGFGSSGATNRLFNVLLSGLPTINSPSETNPANVRHFYKSTSSATNAKPWLGQMLISGNTDEKDWDFSLPISSNEDEINVRVATTGSNINFASAPNSIDGITLLSGNKVLVKDQEIDTENGIYEVTNVGSGTDGVWTRSLSSLPNGSDHRYKKIHIDEGTIHEGSKWYIEDYAGEYQAGTTPILIKSTTWVQSIDIQNIPEFLASLDAELLEIKARSRDTTSPIIEPIKVRFYTDSAGEIGTPLTDWIFVTSPYLNSGRLASYNKLIQIRLNTASLTVSNNTTLWMAIQSPMGCDLASANARSAGSWNEIEASSFRGWRNAQGLWYKIFANAFQRHDNVSHQAVIQMRFRADSHARVQGHASALSQQYKVDISGPVSSATPRPAIDTALPPSVRTAVINIDAEDDDSGIFAFRIAKETDFGAVVCSPWMSWNQFLNGNAAQYTVYLYGTWHLTSHGYYNTTLLAQNTGNDGSRKVWAQVMDGAGNISESFPITLLAQAIAVVDTTPPTGQVAFVSGVNGEIITEGNNQDSWLNINGQDRVTAIKDFRTRNINPDGSLDSWSVWIPFTEYQSYLLDSVDGLKRVEVQLRDYGNNIIPENAVWDALSQYASRGVVFLKACKWDPPISELEESVYLSGIKTSEYNNYKLVDSLNQNYDAYTAFNVISDSGPDIGRRILLRANDEVVVTGTSISYVIDPSQGLIIFDSAPDPLADLRIDIVRTSAVIYRWNGLILHQVADLSFQNEQIALSLASTNNYLYIGCASGNIYAFDGRLVIGPIYNCNGDGDPLPVTCLISHKFAHESEAYIYASTGNTPRLYRAPVLTAANNSAWNRVAAIDDLDISAGSVLSMASGFDHIFIGMNNGKVLKYDLRPLRVGAEEEYEQLTPYSLDAQYLGEDESVTLPVQALIHSGDQIIAGIGDRPEVWSYTERFLPNPINDESWAIAKLDRWFVNDPAPAQFYTQDGVTTSRGHTNLNYQRISDPYSPNGFRDILIMFGAALETTQFEYGIGSDWEQVSSTQYPSSIMDTPCHVATTENITLSGLQTIDGVELIANDRVLVKNQSNAAQNGVYIAQSGSWSRASDLNDAGEFSYRMGIRVTNGDDNARSMWILNTPGPYTVGTTELEYIEPSWTFEAEVMNINGSGAQGIQIGDGFWHLNVSFNRTTATIQSGDNIKSRSYIKHSEITPFMAVQGGLKYPESGVKRIWDFALDSDSLLSQEDQGPYWIGNNTSPNEGINGNVEDWKASQFVIPANDNNDAGIIEAETEYGTASFTAITRFLRITPAKKGDPRIQNSKVDLGADEILADSGAKILVRIRIVSKSGHPILNSKIRASWASDSNNFVNWVEKPLQVSNDFVTYELQPSWSGKIDALSLEITNLPEGDDRPDFIDIDFIAIASNYASPDLRDNLTPIRVAVTGRKVQLYVGKSEQPLIDEVNFMALPTQKRFVKFGKTNIYEDSSTWGWGNLKFLAGAAYPPITREIYDFRLSWRFPSTGGTRVLISHDGTVHALTDGIYLNKIGDNPDDRQMKIWSYQADKEVWKLEGPSPSREPQDSELLGLIRPFDGVSYRGSLIVAGQKGNIRHLT